MKNSYAVISPSVRYSTLKAQEKVLIAEISALSDTRECDAHNSEIAKTLNISASHVSRLISKLIKQGILAVGMRTCRYGTKRILSVVGKTQKAVVKITEPVINPNATMPTPIHKNTQPPTHACTPYKDINSKTNNKFNRVTGKTPATAFKPPTFDEVLEFAKQENFGHKAEAFFKHYTTPQDEPDKHWRDEGGRRFTNWQKKLIAWKNRERPEQKPKGGIINHDEEWNG